MFPSAGEIAKASNSWLVPGIQWHNSWNIVLPAESRQAETISKPLVCTKPQNFLFQLHFIARAKPDVTNHDPSLAIDQERRWKPLDAELLFDHAFLLLGFEEMVGEVVFIYELESTFTITCSFDGHNGQALVTILLPQGFEAWQLHATPPSSWKPESENRHVTSKVREAVPIALVVGHFEVIDSPGDAKMQLSGVRLKTRLASMNSDIGFLQTG